MLQEFGNFSCGKEKGRAQGSRRDTEWENCEYVEGWQRNFFWRQIYFSSPFLWKKLNRECLPPFAVHQPDCNINLGEVISAAGLARKGNERLYPLKNTSLSAHGISAVKEFQRCFIISPFVNAFFRETTRRIVWKDKCNWWCNEKNQETIIKPFLWNVLWVCICIWGILE